MWDSYFHIFVLIKMQCIPLIEMARGGWYVVAATYFVRVKLSPDACSISEELSASVHTMTPHNLQKVKRCYTYIENNNI